MLSRINHGHDSSSGSAVGIYRNGGAPRRGPGSPLRRLLFAQRGRGAQDSALCFLELISGSQQTETKVIKCCLLGREVAVTSVFLRLDEF